METAFLAKNPSSGRDGSPSRPRTPQRGVPALVATKSAKSED